MKGKSVTIFRHGWLMVVMRALPSYGGNAFINFRWVNTYIIA